VVVGSIVIAMFLPLIVLMGGDVMLDNGRQ
jgi:hypothetical protein